MGPTKSVCSFTRLMGMIRSASYAARSNHTGRPFAQSPRCTVSTVVTTGTPRRSSVTPYPASTSRCPSSVPPPWLPIAETMKGFAPSSMRQRTVVSTMRYRFWIPRLPTPTATRIPGFTRARTSGFAISRRTVPSISVRQVSSKRWRTRYMRGSGRRRSSSSRIGTGLTSFLSFQHFIRSCGVSPRYMASALFTARSRRSSRDSSDA